MKVDGSEVTLYEFINDPYIQSQAFKELSRYQETFERLGITLEQLPGIIRQNNLRKKLLMGEKNLRENGGEII